MCDRKRWKWKPEKPEYGSLGFRQPQPIILAAESYRRYAEANGFRQEILEKVIRLGQVVAVVSSDPALGVKFALKGGTAINLIREPIRRLSVDLDFNYVGAIDRQVMLSDKPNIVTGFQRIAEWLGYNIDVPRDEHGGSKFYLRYLNSLGGQDGIEIDVNWITRVPLGSLQRRQLWQPAGLDRPDVIVVPTEELIAGKLRAMIDRVAARDVYDAGFLPQLIHADWPSKETKALFVLLTSTLSLPLTNYSLDRLDKLSEAEFKNKLLPVLSLEERPDRERLISRAKEVLRPMLELESAEREYIDRLQNGEYLPELLLPFNLELAERLKVHPALQWKARNALEHRAKKRRG